MSFNRVIENKHNDTKITVLNILGLEKTRESIIEKIDNGYKCKICNKEARHKLKMSNHIESNYIEGSRHLCEICDDEKTNKTILGLAEHMAKIILKTN